MFYLAKKQLMIHKIIRNIDKFNHCKSYEFMTKTSIKDKKLMVDYMVGIFKSIPATAITFSNRKKN